MKYLDIVKIRSMQFRDFALIVRLHKAYCRDKSRTSWELSHDTQRNSNWDEGLARVETARLKDRVFLQAGAHASPTPQYVGASDHTSRSAEATSTSAENILAFNSLVLTPH